MFLKAISLLKLTVENVSFKLSNYLQKLSLCLFTYNSINTL